MIQRHHLEVDHLHKRPHHPIGAQRLPVILLQLLLHIRPLQDRHGTQENPNERRRKQALVGRHPRQDGLVGATRYDHALLQEAEPRGGGGPEDGAAVQDHATGAGQVVVGQPPTVDELLGGDVADAEEDGGCDGLG